MPSKVKEMEVTPKSASGVKRMPMPGTEKKMKLQEGNLGHSEEWSPEPEGRFWILTYRAKGEKKEKTFDSEDEAKKWIKQNLSEQTLRSLIRNIIKEELNRSDYMQALYALEKPHLSDKDAIQDIVSIYNSHIQQLSSLQGNLEENYETKKDLAQLQKHAQDIEPKAQKLAKALKGKSTTEISKILKEKGITDSDLITRVIDLAAKK